VPPGDNGIDIRDVSLVHCGASVVHFRARHSLRGSNGNSTQRLAAPRNGEHNAFL